jgi:hypothetical protein
MRNLRGKHQSLYRAARTRPRTFRVFGTDVFVVQLFVRRRLGAVILAMVSRSRFDRRESLEIGDAQWELIHVHSESVLVVELRLKNRVLQHADSQVHGRPVV